VLIVHSDADASVPIDHADRIEALYRQRNPRVAPRRLTIHGADHNFDVLGYRPDEPVRNNPRAREVYAEIERFLGGVL
jgi:fermentation-respiration switch protein FrsA (DUF1100 family)